MSWGHSVGAFFAGAFLLNAIPHFVKGVCGDKFPTPFSKPPGKGLSSAPVNAVWGLFNLLAGSCALACVRADELTWGDIELLCGVRCACGCVECELSAYKHAA